MSGCEKLPKVTGSNQMTVGVGAFHRVTSLLISSIYLSVITLPPYAAAQQAEQASSPGRQLLELSSAIPRPADEFVDVSTASARATPDETSEDLRAVSAILDVADMRLRQKVGIAEQLRTLEDLLERLRERAHEQAKALQEVEYHLIAADLPDVIRGRHERVKKQLQSTSQQLDHALTTLISEKDTKRLHARIKKLRAELSRMQLERAQESFDPRNPAIGRQGEAAPLPLDTPAALRRAHPEPLEERALFASLAPIWVGAQLLPPAPEYLLPTTDVQLSQAVIELAAELNNNPVEIYNWVRNNIRFLSTYGSVQGSEISLQSLQGNAFDTASLLIALLRAADIPARYVHGTVEIPVEKAMNWAGGFENAQAAADFLATGGIPTTIVKQSGVIKAIRMQHVWVEALLDYTPSRGAKNVIADAWVALDPSFKLSEDMPSQITPQMAQSIENLLDDYFASADITAGGDISTGFDASLFDAAIDDIAAQLTTYLVAQEDPIPDPEKLLGGREIIAAASPVLPGSLPYKIVARGNDYAALPTTLRARATVEVFRRTDEQLGGAPLVSQVLSLPEMGFKSLNLSHVAASAEDEETWESYAGSTQFPAYLIEVRGRLTLDGAVLAETPALSFGEDLVVRVTFGGAAAPRTARFAIVSGDEVQIGINGNGQEPFLALDIDKRPDIGTAAGNLYAAAKAFWIQQDLADQMAATMMRVAFVRLPSVGVFSSPASITYQFGVPFSARYRGRAIDVKLAQLSAKARNGDPVRSRDFVVHSGMTLSTNEGAVLEAMFNRPLGSAISTAKLIKEANEASVPVYRLTATNVATHRASLQHSAQVMADIDTAVAAGLEVIIPQSRTEGDWTGSGYILLDPVTGTGDYRISGGLSGSFQSECGLSTQPVKISLPYVPFIFLLILRSFTDDDFGATGRPLAYPVAALLAASLIGVVAGGIALAANAAKTGQSVSNTTKLLGGLGALLGTEAAIAGEDGCSCAPELRPRRGGHAFHNACADLPEHTDFPGSDVKVEKKHFDGRKATVLFEVKTGLFYTTIKTVAAQRPRVDKFREALLNRALAEFAIENGIAQICSFDFSFRARDANLVADMIVRLTPLGLSSKVSVTACGGIP